MGIANLQTYMKVDPSMYYKIDIPTTVSKIPIEHRTIVLDGPSCLRTFYSNDDKDYVTGGQFQQCRQNVRDFLQFCKKLDVKVVVFFDGSVISKKRAVWVRRRLEMCDKVHRVLDAVDHNRRFNVEECPIPTNIQSVVSSAFSECCEVFYSTDRECDEEILEYVNKHKCMAILSNDSDFAVSQGDWCFWSGNDLDFKAQSVYVYDKIKLADRLGLEDNQLPLWGALMGNDFISKDLLQIWHHRIYGNRNYKAFIDRKKLFPLVARYVQKYKKPTSADFEHISIDVFRSPDKSELIQQTINSYLGIAQTPKERFSKNKKWNAILCRAHDLIRTRKITSALYGALHNHEFELASNFEDFRRNDLPPSGLFWRQLRTRVYGILFFCDPDRCVIVEEWVCAGPGSLDKATFIKPEWPEKTKFDLYDFWCTDQSEQILNAGWELFCTTINKKFTVEAIKTLPEYIVPTVLTILQMIRGCVLTPWECQAFLIVCILCNSSELAVNSFDKASIVINTRALRLTTLYIRGITTLKMLSQVCGFVIPNQRFRLADIFDGLLFHHFYKEQAKEYRSHPDLEGCMKFIYDHKRYF